MVIVAASLLWENVQNLSIVKTGETCNIGLNIINDSVDLIVPSKQKVYILYSSQQKRIKSRKLLMRLVS